MRTLIALGWLQKQRMRFSQRFKEDPSKGAAAAFQKHALHVVPAAKQQRQLPHQLPRGQAALLVVVVVKR